MFGYGLMISEASIAEKQFGNLRAMGNVNWQLYSPLENEYQPATE